MVKKLFTFGFFAAIGLAVGCSSSDTADADQLPPITAKSVHENMSPELISRAHTSGEIDTRISRSMDTNGRSAWDDLLMFLLLDRPNRATLYPTP
jgi:hypothetical protein